MKKFGKFVFKTVSYTFQAWFITTSLYTIGKLVHQNQEMSKFLKSTENELRGIAEELEKTSTKEAITEEELNKAIDSAYEEGRRDGRVEARDDIYHYFDAYKKEVENDERTDN